MKRKKIPEREELSPGKLPPVALFFSQPFTEYGQSLSSNLTQMERFGQRGDKSFVLACVMGWRQNFKGAPHTQLVSLPGHLLSAGEAWRVGLWPGFRGSVKGTV